MGVLKLLTVSIISLVIATILFAYSFYIIGMAFSLATSPIVSLDNVLIAESFAIIGAVSAIIIFVVIVLYSVNYGAVEALTDIREDDRMAGLRNKKSDREYGTFHASKIRYALMKSSKETGEFGDKEAEGLTNTVVERLDELDELTVENMQDLVENVLLNREYKTTAKAYIIYRELR